MRNLSRKEGDLAQLFGDIVQNITTGIREEISKVDAPALQQVLRGFLTGNHNGSLPNSDAGNDFIDGVLGNVSTSISDGISRAQEAAATGITHALGIQQFYTVHLRRICSGYLSDKSDPKARFDIFGCFAYPQAATGKCIHAKFVGNAVLIMWNKQIYKSSSPISQAPQQSYQQTSPFPPSVKSIKS